MSNNLRRFGTFEGVFTPTILTIVGVIMYLRLGWVVGNAGFGGALLIILLAKLVTVTTGLSIASLTTNVRIGAGGSYTMISRSLGLEVGGAIGIPLYLSQSLGGALYISGFTEAWVSIFPAHSPHLVSTVVLLALLVISLISAKVAMKIQFVIMAIIVGSLISFFMGKGGTETNITLWGNFTKAPFWVVFAIFFPAVTGIEAGAAMSGDVKDPRKNLPVGILAGIGFSLVIYIAVAFWLDNLAAPEELVSNYTIMMDISRWRLIIIAAIFGATLSSALGSIVGGPRTLMALGQDKVLPFYRVFAQKSKKGEPRYSILFTAIIIEVSLLLGDLNTIAPLLTMFFLITYGTLNIAVSIEKGIGIPSFRPTFKIPIIVPIVGGLWSFAVMFLINPVFASIAIILILMFYVVQVKRGLRAPWGDVRSGLFNAIAEWGAKTSARMPRHAKTWKPNLMIPIEDPKSWGHLMEFIGDVVFPKGTLRLFSIKIVEQGVQNKISDLAVRLFKREISYQPSQIEQSVDDLEKELSELSNPIKEKGIFTANTVIECQHFIEGISIITQIMRGMFFPPNIIFLTMSTDPQKDKRLEEIIAIAIREKLGICVLLHHPKGAFGKNKEINVWLRFGSPNKDLAILTALQLQRNWNGHIRLLTAVKSKDEKRKATIILNRIAEWARIPSKSEISVIIGDFKEILQKAPPADLNVFGVSDDFNCNSMRELSTLSEISCIFVKDSGEESILA